MSQFLLGRTAALAATLTCGVAAVAHACVKTNPSNPPVCNTASKHSLGGTLDAQDPPVRQPSNRYRHHLYQKPGHGRGLPGAASHSPSLSICGPGDGGGITTLPTDTTPTPPTDPGTTTPPTDTGPPPPTGNDGSTNQPGHSHPHHGHGHDGGGTTPPTDGGTTPPTDTTPAPPTDTTPAPPTGGGSGGT
jgi:hypothetical protein